MKSISARRVGLELLDHNGKNVDVAEVTSHEESKGRHGFEDLLEHERNPSALENRDMKTVFRKGPLLRIIRLTPA